MMLHPRWVKEEEEEEEEEEAAVVAKASVLLSSLKTLTKCTTKSLTWSRIMRGNERHLQCCVKCKSTF